MSKNLKILPVICLFALGGLLFFLGAGWLGANQKMAYVVSFILLENVVLLLYLFASVKKIAKLKKDELMKNDFISFVSHQLRTPLTVVKWNVEMLEDETTDKLSTKQKQFLNQIRLEEKQISNLVSSLLNISRLESGRIKIDPMPEDILAAISETVNELSAYARAKHCSISFTKPNLSLPPVSLDKALFKQVILNLLNNAINYSKSDRCGVKVDFKDAKEYYMISVADDGIGIPPEACERIFSKFFRAENAIKANSVGTGLGLYMTKLIVEISGGKIWFATKNGTGNKFQEKDGTTFYFTVPKKGMKKNTGSKGLLV
ncbi:MAG TPA: HAMP domain-containing sensor histidine kinase [Candidatus Udaeobacter sp.]|nr:HAMP domain-containing sensor histidine kinase [Candidatus Udaeobacter sp.]